MLDIILSCVNILGRIIHRPRFSFLHYYGNLLAGVLAAAPLPSIAGYTLLGGTDAAYYTGVVPVASSHVIIIIMYTSRVNQN